MGALQNWVAGQWRASMQPIHSRHDSLFQWLYGNAFHQPAAHRARRTPSAPAPPSALPAPPRSPHPCGSPGASAHRRCWGCKHSPPTGLAAPPSAPAPPHRAEAHPAPLAMTAAAAGTAPPRPSSLSWRCCTPTAATSPACGGTSGGACRRAAGCTCCMHENARACGLQGVMLKRKAGGLCTLSASVRLAPGSPPPPPHGPAGMQQAQVPALQPLRTCSPASLQSDST